ncbi:MAG: tol-pal system-associated acyl-CoA thioesterase [Sinobacteraceae bacterium]|nr:tol-pal system-associated acyl-CoA thioesterase [Nevskiaceae bacterium]
MTVTLPLRVYYEDTDASGVVYHATYLRYFERARTEWLRSLGFEHHELMKCFGIAFTLASINVEFLRPARLDDALTVDAEIGRIKRASLDFVQHIHRKADATLLCRARARIACVEMARFRPCALPAALRTRLAVDDSASSLPAANKEYSAT